LGGFNKNTRGVLVVVWGGVGGGGASHPPTAVADAQAALPSANYHWYRLKPGQRSWVLIESANGTTYVPAPIDIGQNLMVVAVVNQNGQVKRVASTPVGPVR
jgi:hypothetical protein